MVRPVMLQEPGVDPAIQLVVQDGLATYAAGDGEPMMLMPYPHGFGLPFAEWPLAHALRQLNRRVVTYDPPGVGVHTTRPARISMEEMIDCADEALAALDIREPIDLVGHSMGGFCALGYALALPQRVKRLILIGTLSGGPAIQRGRGMPWGNWLTGRDRWRFIILGMRLNLGIGNLAVHKQLLRLLWKASYADKRQIPEIALAPDDHRQPAPVRDAWPRVALRLDYRDRLAEIRVPTLICVGRFDPQAPVPCSEELARGIAGARLEIFEHSGHYPFSEEPERFRQVVGQFLAAPTV